MGNLVLTVTHTYSQGRRSLLKLLKLMLVLGLLLLLLLLGGMRGMPVPFVDAAFLPPKSELLPCSLPRTRRYPCSWLPPRIIYRLGGHVTMETAYAVPRVGLIRYHPVSDPPLVGPLSIWMMLAILRAVGRGVRV